MGWTSKDYRTKTHLEFDLNDAGELLQEEICNGNYNLIGATLAKAHYKEDNNVIYALIRHPEGYLFLLVVLVDIVDNEIYWKEVDETMGPSESRCPIEYIKLLPDTKSEYSKAWRERCLKNNVSINKDGLQNIQIQYS